MFACVGPAEQACYYKNMEREAGAPLSNPKEPTKRGGTLALLLPKPVLVWVYAWYKVWEGRTVRACMRMWGRLDCQRSGTRLAWPLGVVRMELCTVLSRKS